MRFSTFRTARWVLIGFAVLLFAACGGGGSSSGTNTSGRALSTGTVGVLLTDKPADPSLFTSIYASIESIELLGTDENDRVTLYSGPTKTFDLLRLKNEAIPFTFKDNVPTGRYCKIRLTLSALELVLSDDTPDDLTDNETHHPSLPGNGKLDLVARDCFTVGPGEVITLQLDIDAGNSIHINENRNGYKFRPVVFVDVLNQDFEAKLVRLEGKITKIDADQNKLLLCEAMPTQQINKLGCVTIHTGQDTAFFDNLDFSGEPRPLEELLDKLDNNVTVVGWPRYSVEPYFDEVPEGHFPPPGECRLWDINLESGQQSAPIDCDQLPEILPEDHIVITHEGVEKDPYRPLMVLDALVVELGDFLQVEGQVVADSFSTGFSMSVSAGGPVITDAPLNVMYQESASGVNGTRIISKSGELLDLLDITVPRTVQVDGVLDLVTDINPLLKAALVIIDSEQNTERVTGTVLDVGADTFTVAPDAEIVCGESIGQLIVRPTNDAEYFTVTITDLATTIVPGGILEPGQIVGLQGFCAPTEYESTNIVIVDDQRE